MSMSATLYRISDEVFQPLFDHPGGASFDMSTAKDSCLLQQTFMALEFLITKVSATESAGLIKEIFSPQTMIGQTLYEEADIYEQFELIERSVVIPFLDKEKIARIDKILSPITTEMMRGAYNSKELNDHDVYPGVWHDDESEDLALNRRDVTTDFTALKNFFQLAQQNGDYILVFAG